MPKHIPKIARLAKGARHVAPYVKPTLIFFTPVAVVMVFPLLMGTGSEDPGEGVKRLTGILKLIPVQMPTYVLLASFVGARLAAHRWLFSQLQNEFADKKNAEDDDRDLSGHDWWVAEDLRKRALALRLRADILLLGVLGLLFGGIYFVLFVLFEVEQSEITEIRRDQFRARFSQIMQPLAEGRYWVKTDNRLGRQLFDLGKSRAEDTEVVMADHKTLFLTENGGQSWKRADVPLGPGDIVTALAVSEDGGSIAAGSPVGLVTVTTDGGQSWNSVRPPLGPDQGAVTALAVSEDGQTVAVGISEGAVRLSEGPVSVTMDGGQSWVSSRLPPGKEPAAVTALAVSEDGRTVAAGLSEGPVYVTMDGGQSWERAMLPLGRGDMVTALAVSEDGGRIVGGRSEFLASIAKEGEGTRARSSSILRPPAFRPDDEMRMLAVSRDTQTAVVAGSRSPAYVTTDAGLSWVSRRLPLGAGEGVRLSAVSKDAQTAVIFGFRGPAFATMDKGQTWRYMKLPESVDFRLPESGDFSFNMTAGGAEGQVGLLEMSSSVFITTDAGDLWRSAALTLGSDERVDQMVVSGDDSRTAVVKGSEGSVFITANGGRDWRSTELAAEAGEWVEEVYWLGEGEISSQEGQIYFPGGIVGRTTRGNYCYLLAYSAFSDWRNWPLQRIVQEMEADSLLRRSLTFRRISMFVDQTAEPTNDRSDSRTRTPEGVLGLFQLDGLTIQRIVASTILFFLVQLLVRLYQYSLRLAAFWESRSDALLLNQSFTERKAETFDDLVNALSPDAYDFKAMPKAPLDWLQPRNKQ